MVDAIGLGVCRCGTPLSGEVRGLYWHYTICPRRRWWNSWRHDKPYLYGFRLGARVRVNGKELR
jgi:hypothetical protein